MTDQALIRLAFETREHAYAPYSGFAVGTAYTGCNVENAAYPVGLCAERTALAKAVSEGKMGFVRIAICGGRAGEDATEYCAPCGMCRQALAEFCGGDFEILLPAKGWEPRRFALRQLLPETFGPQNLS